FRAGKTEEAHAAALSALRAGEETYGPQHPNLLTTLFNLGVIQRARRKTAEAESALKRALAIYEGSAAHEWSAAEHSLAAELLDFLGFYHFEARDFGAAEKYWGQAVAVGEKVPGADNERVGRHVIRLAEFHRLRTGLKKAGLLYLRAVELLLKSPGKNRELLDLATDGYHCSLINSTLEYEEVLEAMNAVGRMRADAEPKPKAWDSPVTLQAGVINGKALSKPQPDYPRAARDQRLMGGVAVKIVVDERGRVTEATPMCAHPILMEAARDAALRARFTPTTLGGVPVRVAGVITYRFVLR
ncbi:MAG TPA: TonB family protein, partial [Pyrinomonadaceae bacterium]|nr:TonB family protein [Pyrinomonadaceae bacterium]